MVALEGLAVAVITVWLGYRERAAGHRDALYARQLDAHTEVAQAVGAFYVAAAEFADHTKSNEELEDLVTRAEDDLAAARRTWAPILPSRTTQALDKLRDAWGHILPIESGWPQVEAAYLHAIATMRDVLSVEPLTEASLKVTGQLSRERRHRTPATPGDGRRGDARRLPTRRRGAARQTSRRVT